MLRRQYEVFGDERFARLARLSNGHLYNLRRSRTYRSLKLPRFGGHQMSNKRPPYAPEYRRQMVELVRAGRTAKELAREFECSASAIRNWVRQADRDEGRREDGLTSSELEELRQLRRENRQLREEREILKKGNYIE